MKQGRSLPEVLTELQRQNAAKQDYIGAAEALRLDDDGSTFNIGTDHRFGTTQLFHRQVASALGIPAKYYDMMQKQKPDLLADNVNAWFSDKSSSYMVRTLDYGSGQVARALLSDRYRRIDNLEIASAILPIFAGQDGMEVMSCEVTENKLYLKIVNHRLEMACVGDRVQAGVIISNSEVGLGAVSIQPLVYTLACTNGMVVNSMGERRTHVGRAAKALEDSFNIYTDETLEAEDKAFMLKLRDTAPLSRFRPSQTDQFVSTNKPEISCKRIVVYFFKVIRREIIAVTVNSYCVVECLDVFKHEPVGVVIAADFEPVQPFALYQRMKRLNAGIVVWIPLL